MLNFVKTAFSGFIVFVLWINMIIFMVGCGIGGYFLAPNGSERGGYIFLGILMGIVIGLLSNIMFGGFIATIINIDKNIHDQNEILKRYLKITTGMASDRNFSEEKMNSKSKHMIRCKECDKMINVNNIECPYCGKELTQNGLIQLESDISYNITVIKETALNDSLGLDAKLIRYLKIGEKIKINNILENFNKNWAYIETKNNKEEGWCLLDTLSEQVMK